MQGSEKTMENLRIPERSRIGVQIQILQKCLVSLRFSRSKTLGKVNKIIIKWFPPSYEKPLLLGGNCVFGDHLVAQTQFPIQNPTNGHE